MYYEIFRSSGLGHVDFLGITKADSLAEAERYASATFDLDEWEEFDFQEYETYEAALEG